jgi:acyl-coenzyme A thioesterase PaaI-like protein
MKKQALKQAPCTVTAEYAIRLLRPTPSSQPLTMTAKVVSIGEDRAEIEAKLESGGKVCATCKGLFVAVKEGHPAFHRW